MRFLSTLFLILIALTVSPGVGAAEADAAPDDGTDSLVKERIEREAEDNRSVLPAHERNYVLPLAYSASASCCRTCDTVNHFINFGDSCLNS